MTRGHVPYLGNAAGFVRITGTRREKFVEFEFSVNDQDLTVALVMPIGEFHEFCRRANVTVLPPDGRVADELEKLQEDGPAQPSSRGDAQ